MMLVTISILTGNLKMTAMTEISYNPKQNEFVLAKRDQQEGQTLHSPKRRDNEDWLADIRGPNPSQALTDLHQILLKNLRFTFASSRNLREENLEDFVQDAMIRILAALDTFRGESQFTTWATKIAIRIAYTELRRLRWKDISLNELIGEDPMEVTKSRFVPVESTDTELLATQRIMLEKLHRIIREELTEKQSRALLATCVYGMSLEETARQMGTNRNALYKLIHDARLRLKVQMNNHGISAQDLLAYFEQSHTSTSVS